MPLLGSAFTVSPASGAGSSSSGGGGGAGCRAAAPAGRTRRRRCRRRRLEAADPALVVRRAGRTVTAVDRRAAGQQRMRPRKAAVVGQGADPASATAHVHRGVLVDPWQVVTPRLVGRPWIESIASSAVPPQAPLTLRARSTFLAGSRRPRMRELLVEPSAIEPGADSRGGASLLDDRDVDERHRTRVKMPPPKPFASLSLSVVFSRVTGAADTDPDSAAAARRRAPAQVGDDQRVADGERAVGPDPAAPHGRVSVDLAVGERARRESMRMPPPLSVGDIAVLDAHVRDGHRLVARDMEDAANSRSRSMVARPGPCPDRSTSVNLQGVAHDVRASGKLNLHVPKRAPRVACSHRRERRRSRRRVIGGVDSS